MTAPALPLWSLSRWRRSGRIAIEMTAAFVLLVAVDRIVGGGDGFSHIQPNPLWVPVLVMALAYGTGPGVVAAAIASALWLVHAPRDAVERDYLDHLLHLSLPPLLWFVAAIAVGEVTIIRAGRHQRSQRRGDGATRNVARMTDAFGELSSTNRKLQMQIAIEERTVGRVIDTATRLSSADPAERRAAIVQLIGMAAQTGDFTCYRIAGGEAPAWLRGSAATTAPDILPLALLERAFRRSAILHVARPDDRAALAGVGVVAIALRRPGGNQVSGDELIGCLVLHTLPFASLGAGRTAEFAEIARWLAPLLADTLRPPQRSVRRADMVA